MQSKLESLFGSGPEAISALQRRVQSSTHDAPWGAQSFYPRGLLWRVFLGLLPLPDANFANWRAELSQQSSDYARLREATMPSLTKVAADPLSASLADSDPNSEATDEWTVYYKNVELSNFINGDLDRLYMNGIEDEYFQSEQRRELLLSVLLLWALLHKKTSYRQGMHELAGPILYVLEQELEQFTASGSDNIFGLSRASTLEAHTFVIFSRIMQDLDVLYDPTPSPHSPDRQPEVVAFCTKIQETTLRKVDQQLCQHLEASYVQAQLYGMRWSRLLFGREFPLTHSHGLRVWDFLFAQSLDLGETHQGSSSASAGNSHKKGTSSMLLKAVADMVLAMLLFVRDDLLSDDPSVTMGVLMHYPQLESVGPVFDVVDMVKRGVVSAAMTSGASFSSTTTSSSSSMTGTSGARKRGSSKSGPQTPSWLLGAKKAESAAISIPTSSAAQQSVSSSLATLLGNFDSTDPLGGGAQPLLPRLPGKGLSVAPIPEPAPVPVPLPAPVPVPASSSPSTSATAVQLLPSAPQESGTKTVCPTPPPPSATATSVVGDRLYALSEHLSRMQGALLLDEAEVRGETARRVRMLANVLVGLGDVNEYDELFPAKK